jgi:hypothetical protein
MLSFTVDRHTTISDILDNFNGYYSYASGQPFAPKKNKGNDKSNGKDKNTVRRYNAPTRNFDFRSTISNPLEISGLNRYDED